MGSVKPLERVFGCFNGIEVSYSAADDLLKVVEVGVTKSWKAMLSFAERFPLGSEPEWTQFVIKHAKMQDEEMQSALASAARKARGA